MVRLKHPLGGYLLYGTHLIHHVDDAQVEHCVRNLLQTDQQIHPNLPPGTATDYVEDA